MSNINLKIVLFGIFLFLINIYILYAKLSNENYKFFMVSSRADLLDGYFGFVILIILFILSISVISYGLKHENKLSKIGKYIIHIFSILLGRNKKN
jgi:hypothetical protein